MGEDGLKLFAVLLGDGALFSFGLWQVIKMRRLRAQRERARQEAAKSASEPESSETPSDSAS
jgi:hypothetical protein